MVWQNWYVGKFLMENFQIRILAFQIPLGERPIKAWKHGKTLHKTAIKIVVTSPWEAVLIVLKLIVIWLLMEWINPLNIEAKYELSNPLVWIYTSHDDFRNCILVIIATIAQKTVIFDFCLVCSGKETFSLPLTIECIYATLFVREEFSKGIFAFHSPLVLWPVCCAP